jgi:hypothetical protein
VYGNEEIADNESEIKRYGSAEISAYTSHEIG